MDTRTTATATTTDGLLPLLWLASPALPVGGFSYSEGLEAAVEASTVCDEPTAAHWLADQLHMTIARGELVVVARVVADPKQAPAMDSWYLRTRETSELRQQAVQMGKSLGVLTPGLPQAMTYPVAWALAAASFDVDVRDAMTAYAFGWAENVMQAAVRAVPLGQSAGQRILARLAREIPAAVQQALAAESPQAFSPMLAILSSRHENQYSRLFRS